MRLTITEVAVAALPASSDSAQTYYWDDDLPGFGVVVSKTGRKVFVMRRRDESGALKKVTIGEFGNPWTVGGARAEAERVGSSIKLNYGNPAQLPSGAWRIQFFDESGKRKSATFATEEEARSEQVRRKNARRAAKTHAFGQPVRFRVIGVYSNGAERDLTAVEVSDDRGYDRGIGFTSHDEEFCVFVARRPLLTAEPHPYDVWQFDPETDIDRGGPF